MGITPMLVPTETLATPDISAKLVNVTLEPVAFQMLLSVRHALGTSLISLSMETVEYTTESRWVARRKRATTSGLILLIIHCAQKTRELQEDLIARIMVIVHQVDAQTGVEQTGDVIAWAPLESLAMVQMEPQSLLLESTAMETSITVQLLQLNGVNLEIAKVDRAHRLRQEEEEALGAVVCKKICSKVLQQNTT
jgi:hypothetical protein